MADGADTLEVDLRLTADARVVALHDASLVRTTGVPGAVADLTLRDLRAIPADVRPPRLSALLGRYGGEVRLLLELKDPTRLLVRRVVTAVERAGLHDTVELQSFDPRILRWLPAPGRTPARSVLLDAAPVPGRFAELRALGASGVGVRAAAVDAALVADAHRAGLVVRAWTVNDPAEATRLRACGVDGLITDDPARLRPATVLALAA